MEYMVARVQQQQHAAHAPRSYNNTMMPHLPPPPHLSPPPLQQAGPPEQHRPPPPVSQRTRGSATMKQQARLALEQEVAELRQHLSNEQAVHDILERALQPGAGRSVVLSSIPAFIPGKAKELLAELVLVEEEIARLETHIHEMKGGLTAMQQQRAAMTQARSPSLSPRPSAAADNVQPPPPRKVVAPAPEMKSMFFITQAMDHLAGAGGGAADDKASHKDRSPRNSSNAFSRNSLEKPPKHELPIITKSPKNKMQPNKLSERIVKCLVCIFIRLLRSSRAAELERSSAGNAAARSGGTNSHQLQGSFSFRIDAGLTVAAKEKQERGQQDHYGIFGIPDAIVRDIGPYKNLVRFTSSSFDLRGFSTSPLLTKLREMLEALQQVDLRFLSHQQKLAFWLNIYNTCIMHGILQHGLPSNSERLLALKNKATINVSGQKFNALVIENFILRQPSSVKEEFWKCDVDVEEQEVRGLYGLKNSEPNILFALCCGIRSSPALRIYKADRVVADLEKAKLEYLQASLVVTSTRRLMIPSLVHSNMHDFAKDMESLVRWVCDQLPTSWSLRKSMVDCLRGQMHLKQVEDVVDVIPFDYEFQYLLPM